MIDLLTDEAYADLIAAFDRELRRVDERAMNAIAVQTLEALATDPLFTAAPPAAASEPQRLFEVDLHATVLEVETYRVRAHNAPEAVRAVLALEVDARERAFLEVRERAFARVRELGADEIDPEELA